MSKTIDENAFERYFYWKGDWGKNLINVCKDTYKKGGQSAAYFNKKMRRSGKNVLLGFLYFFALISSYVCTILILLVFSILFLAIFLILWLCNFLFALLFGSMERLYQRFYGIFGICPVCNKRIDMPIYLCSKCGAEHQNLLPTAQYGILYRKCKCGQRIPSSIMWGKNNPNKVLAKCPNCGNTRGIQMDCSPTTIAFIGGVNVGKTFLRDSMAVTFPKFAVQYKISYTVPQEDKSEWQALEKRMAKGILPERTAYIRNGNILAMKIDILRLQQRVTERVYLYDPPGESFDREEKLDPYNYYQNLKTAVFVVDPLSLIGVRSRLTKPIEHMSMDSAISCFNTWLNSMENSHFEGNLDQLTQNVKSAVVITKIDVPELMEIVQLPANASSEECKQFLQENEAGGIVAFIENHFKVHRFFAVSCTGGVEPGHEFKPQGIDNLWKWILD